MRYLVSLFVLLHGAIHLLGAVKGLRLGEVSQLTQPISTRGGWLWLIAATLLMTAAVLYLALPRWWWLPGALGLVLSQWLIVGAWSDARFGTIANVIVLVPLVIAMAELLPSSLRSQYERASGVALAASPGGTPPLVTEVDLAPLPDPVRRWLTRAGVVGRPRVRSFRLTFDAKMRGSEQDPWMQATAEQVEVFQPAARLFLMRASKGGVPVVVLHRYEGSNATMDVRLAGLVPVQHLSGPEATQSETVTLLNDICLLAPGALFDVRVTWEPIDDRSARVTYTNAGHTVRAVLWFDAHGDLANFTSDDRSMAKGAAMVRTPFSTPVMQLGQREGVRIVTDGEARYREGGRDWAYGRFVLTSMAYNVRVP